MNRTYIGKSLIPGRSERRDPLYAMGEKMILGFIHQDLEDTHFHLGLWLKVAFIMDGVIIPVRQQVRGSVGR